MKSNKFANRHLEKTNQASTVFKKMWSQPSYSLLKISDTHGAKDPGAFDSESGQGSLKGSAS